MSQRRASIDISGFQHSNPVPNASRIDGIVMSGLIVGREPGGERMPEGLDEQLGNMFAHVEEIMAAAGGGLDDVLKLTVWLADAGDRRLLNDHWTRLFPDAARRPARMVLPMPEAFARLLVMCDVTAIIDGADRRSAGGRR